MLLALRACGANVWKMSGQPQPQAEAGRTDGQARAVLSDALHPRHPASSVAGIPARHRRCLCMASSHPRHAVPIWSRPGAGLRSQARSACMRSVAHRRKDPCCPCGLGQCLTRAPKIAGRRQGRKGRKGRKGYRIRQEEALPAVQIVPRGASGVPLCPGFPATWCRPCTPLLCGVRCKSLTRQRKLALWHRPVAAVSRGPYPQASEKPRGPPRPRWCDLCRVHGRNLRVPLCRGARAGRKCLARSPREAYHSSPFTACHPRRRGA